MMMMILLMLQRFSFSNLSRSSSVQGLNGILDAYHSCVSAVRLYGPTNFAPVIKEAASASAEIGDGSRYQVCTATFLGSC